MTDDDLKGRFDTIDRRFDAVDQRFEAVDRRFEAVDRRFDAVDQRFAAVDQRFDAVETAIREDGIATRRHMDIIAESLRSEIRVIAEGHAVLTDKAVTTTSRQDRTDTRVDRLEVQQLGHEHRLRKLEGPGR